MLREQPSHWRFLGLEPEEYGEAVSEVSVRPRGVLLSQRTGDTAGFIWDMEVSKRVLWCIERLATPPQANHDACERKVLKLERELESARHDVDWYREQALRILEDYAK